MNAFLRDWATPSGGESVAPGPELNDQPVARIEANQEIEFAAPPDCD